jgi:formylglycine-generating enzyme required for sulfatase activity
MKLSIVLCVLLFFYSCQKNTSVNDGYGEYLLVPAGEFQMGDNYNEGMAHEKPVHSVYLDEYYFGKYQVTNGEFKQFIEDGGYTNKDYWNAGGYGECGELPRYWDNDSLEGGGIPGNEDFPVIGVSWYEANAYCSWLSEKTDKVYRLPTEAEWEKAARGVDQRRYPWGDSLDGSYANYGSSGDPFTTLTPAGLFDGSQEGEFLTHDNASPYGIYDMAGNVWEWCSDWYGNDYYAVAPKENPQGPDSGIKKVIRGGSWISVPDLLRSAFRGGNDPPTLRYYTLGFRCVREY